MWAWVGSACRARNTEGFDLHDPLFDGQVQETVGLGLLEVPLDRPLPAGFPLRCGDLDLALKLLADVPQKLGRFHWVSPWGHW